MTIRKSCLKSSNDGLSSSVSSSSRRNAMKGKREVRWTKTCSLRVYVMPTAMDRSNIWYSQEDYETFKRECDYAVHLVQDFGLEMAESILQKSSISTSCCCYGLEARYDYDRINHLQRSRMKGWCTVLDTPTGWKFTGDNDVRHGLEEEGHDDDDDDNDDPEMMIAFAYRKVCSTCGVEAYRRGLELASEVATFANVDADDVGTIISSPPLSSTSRTTSATTTACTPSTTTTTTARRKIHASVVSTTTTITGAGHVGPTRRVVRRQASDIATIKKTRKIKRNCHASMVATTPTTTIVPTKKNVIAWW